MNPLSPCQCRVTDIGRSWCTTLCWPSPPNGQQKGEKGDCESLVECPSYMLPQRGSVISCDATTDVTNIMPVRQRHSITAISPTGPVCSALRRYSEAFPTLDAIDRTSPMYVPTRIHHAIITKDLHLGQTSPSPFQRLPHPSWPSCACRRLDNPGSNR